MSNPVLSNSFFAARPNVPRPVASAHPSHTSVGRAPVAPRPAPQPSAPLHRRLNDDDGGGTQTVKLTRREIEVLTLVIEGNSSTEVADKLFVSKRTVDFHLANVYRKLSVKSRLQAYHEATRRGLLPGYSLTGNGLSASRQ